MSKEQRGWWDASTATSRIACGGWTVYVHFCNRMASAYRMPDSDAVIGPEGKLPPGTRWRHTKRQPKRLGTGNS